MMRGGGGGGQVEPVVDGRRRRGSLPPLFLTCLSLIIFIPQASFTEVTYLCFSKGENNLYLECPPNSRLRIIEALHGRNKWGTCVLLRESEQHGTCTQPQMDPVAEQCCGSGRCNMTLAAIFIPSCGYPSSFMRVIHECVTDINVTCRAGRLTNPQIPQPATSLPPTSTSIQLDDSQATESSTTFKLDSSDKSSMKTSSTATIDPVRLAKLNNTKWNGERHIVVKARPPNPSQGGSDASLRAVWACLAIALIIIGSLLGVLFYVWRRKKLQESPGANEPPDNNNYTSPGLEDRSAQKTIPAPDYAASPGVGNPSFERSPEPRIIRVASRRRYSSMREFQTKDCSVFNLPDPIEDDTITGPSRLNRTLSMNSFVVSDTLTRKRKNRDGDIQLVIKPDTEADPV